MGAKHLGGGVRVRILAWPKPPKQILLPSNIYVISSWEKIVNKYVKKSDQKVRFKNFCIMVGEGVMIYVNGVRGVLSAQ